MALVSCPECGRQVSTKAVACPKCGYPVAEPGDADTNRDSSRPPTAPDRAVPLLNSLRNRFLFVIVAAIATVSALGNMLVLPLLVKLTRSDHSFSIALSVGADLMLIGLGWLFRRCKGPLAVLCGAAGISLLLTFSILVRNIQQPPESGIFDGVGMMLMGNMFGHWIVTLFGGLVAGVVWVVVRLVRRGVPLAPSRTGRSPTIR